MKTSNPPTYEVRYAYPSSPNAVQYGFAKSGCYTVCRVKGKTEMTLSGHEMKSQAQEEAGRLSKL